MRPTRMCGKVEGVSPSALLACVATASMKAEHFVRGDAALEGDPLDLLILEPLDQFAHRWRSPSASACRRRRTGRRRCRRSATGAAWSSGFSAASRPSTLRADAAGARARTAGWRGRRRRTGAARRRRAPTFGCRGSMRGSLIRGAPVAARAAARVPRFRSRRRGAAHRRPAACRSCRSEAAAAVRARRARSGAHQSPRRSASLQRVDRVGVPERAERFERRQVDAGVLRRDPGGGPGRRRTARRRRSRMPASSATSVCAARPLTVPSALTRIAAASSLPFSTRPCTASRCTSGSLSVSSGISSSQPFRSAELAQQERRRSPHFPVRGVHQLLDDVAPLRAEARRARHAAAVASARPARPTALRRAARSPACRSRGTAARTA